jgi:F-box interacting protein
MDDETTAPAEAKRTKRNKHLPHEIVTEILLHLPVTSLLRFRRVCKAWLGTIANDPSFGGAHLRLHRQNKNRPYLVIAPQIEAIDVEDDDDEDSHGSWESGSVATAGLYTWEEVHNTATLMHPMGTLPDEVVHDMAHCDGLVLAPTESRVRVINPATHRVLTLPLSLGGVAPRRTPSRSFSHQAFGLGHDPRSDTYKVARFFHRTERNPVTATDRYVPRVEVFAVGTSHQHWRETTRQPPYPVVPRRTATFFEGSLLWTIDQRHREAVPGFLRFMLDDETFHVVPAPPPFFSQGGFNDDESSTLSELCGRLCLTCRGISHGSLDMWVCGDIIDGVP